MTLERICKMLGRYLKPALCDEGGNVLVGRVVLATAASAAMSVIALTLAMPDSLNLGPEMTTALREVRPVAVVVGVVFGALAGCIALGAAGLQLYLAPMPGNGDRRGERPDRSA